VQPKPLCLSCCRRIGRSGLGQIPVRPAKVSTIGFIQGFEPADCRLVVHRTVAVDLCDAKRLFGGQICVREPRDLGDWSYTVLPPGSACKRLSDVEGVPGSFPFDHRQDVEIVRQTLAP